MPSSRTRWVPLHCSGQVLVSWQGLQRKLPWMICTTWSRQRTTACWAPWDPGEVVVGKSWGMECCPLEHTHERKLGCMLGGVYAALTFGVLGTSTHGVGRSMLLPLWVYFLWVVGTGRWCLEHPCDIREVVGLETDDPHTCQRLTWVHLSSEDRVRWSSASAESSCC